MPANDLLRRQNMLTYLSRWKALKHFPLVYYVLAEDYRPGEGSQNEERIDRQAVVLESQHARCYVCLEDYPPPQKSSSLIK